MIKHTLSLKKAILPILGVALGSTLPLLPLSAQEGSAQDAAENGWDFDLNLAERLSPDRWHAGLVARFKESIYKGGDTQVSPGLARIRNSDLPVKGPALTFYRQPDYQVYVGVGFDEWDKDRGDSRQLRDMRELDRAVNMRVGLAGKVSHGTLGVEVAHDVAGAHEGAQARLRYTYGQTLSDNSWRPYIEGQWLSGDITDYYVGVSEGDARAGRPRYKAGDDFAIKVGLDIDYPLANKFTMVGGLSYTHFGDEVGDSPIVETQDVWGAYVGVAYRWD